MKNWERRLLETWAVIDRFQGVPTAKVAALRAYHNGLAEADKRLVSETMAQGAYTHAKPSIFTRGNTRARMKLARTTEKQQRQFRRALILIFMANYNSGNVRMDLRQALLVLPVNVTGVAEQRVKAELINLNSNIIMMKAGGQVLDINWAGWDQAKRRPLLAGCSIGRRGALGPGTLGCFVTIGPDVFILSNRHVLRQEGLGGLSDTEIIQPPHQVGGTYFDDVATFHAEFATHDAALAKVKTGIVCSNTTVAGTAIRGSAVATQNGAIRKVGCATGERRGLIVDVAAPPVSTGRGSPVLVNQILVDRYDPFDPKGDEVFQVKGDSGSVAIDHNHRVVALLHGQVGQKGAQGTHIAPILQHFGAQILVGVMTAP